ncbi:MAG: tetratricopeptide repeat protein [Polyangia bacterium]
MRFFAAVLSLTAACCWVAVCAAQTQSDRKAKMQFEQGIELYNQGRYEQAAVAFETAYELKPSWKILFNLAQAENEQGRYASALKAYTRYLAEGGDEVPDERVAQVKKEIKRLNALVGMVVLSCDVDGATVYVDGKRRGETPLSGPLFVDLGEREIAIKSGAEELHSEVVRVKGGQRVELEVLVGEEPEKEEPAEEAPLEPLEEDRDDGAKRVWTWVALGVGGAAAVGVGITGGMAKSRTDEISKECDGDSCPPDQREELDSAGKLVTAANVLTGVAAAGIVAGAVLFFVEPGLGESEVIVAPTASGDGAGVAVVGRF